MKELDELMPATTCGGLLKIFARLAAGFVVFFLVFGLAMALAYRRVDAPLRIFFGSWEYFLVAYVSLCMVYAALYWLRKSKHLDQG